MVNKTRLVLSSNGIHGGVNVEVVRPPSISLLPPHPLQGSLPSQLLYAGTWIALTAQALFLNSMQVRATYLGLLCRLAALGVARCSA